MRGGLYDWTGRDPLAQPITQPFTGSHSDTDDGPNAHSDTGLDSDADSNAHSDAGLDSDTGLDAHSDTGPNAYSDTGPNADTRLDAHSDTGPNAERYAYGPSGFSDLCGAWSDVWREHALLR